MKLHKNACSLPWKHFALGIETNGPIVFPCCRFLFDDKTAKYRKEKYDIPSIAISKSGYFEDVRNRMQSGEKLYECRKCWDQELAGKQSMRKKYNKTFAPKNILKNEKLEYLEISFSNLCNLACRMCNIMDSSSWANLYNKTFYLENNPDKHTVPSEFLDKTGKAKTKVINVDSFDLSNIDLSNLKEIKILGGEPMMSAGHEEFLKNLSKQSKNANQIEITYHTNATKRPSQEVVEIWKQFKKVTIVFSIDGLKEVNEYQRTFSNWETIEENIEWFTALPMNSVFGVHSTLSILSAWNYDELYNWIIKNDKISTEISIDFVRYPDYLNLSYMPEQYKVKYIEKILNSNLEEKDKIQIKNYILSNSSNDLVWEEFLTRMKQLDKFTKKDITKIIPIETK